MTRQLPIYSLSQFCAPKPTARTLINARIADRPPARTNKAFLCWQTVGRGRIVYLAAPAVYQLRMKFGDRYHYRFWGQLIRWAVARDLSQGSKTVKLATDRSRAFVGENVQVIANLSDAGGRPVPERGSAGPSLDGRPRRLVDRVEARSQRFPAGILANFHPAKRVSVSL